MCSYAKSGDVSIITISGGGGKNHLEHRLNESLIDSIRDSLEKVLSDSDSEPESDSDSESESESTGPTALITTAHGEFFSYGYDYKWAQSDPNRLKIMSEKLRFLVAELISFPMPTIAVVNGHASAAGFILALSHDYVVMRKDQGSLYLHDVGARSRIPKWFIAILKSKIGCPRIWRDVILDGVEITAERGAKWGIIYSAHEGEKATMDAAVKLGNELAIKKEQGEIYASNRRALLSDVLAAMASDETLE